MATENEKEQLSFRPMIWRLNALGVGNYSRQGAKSPSLERKDINSHE